MKLLLLLLLAIIKGSLSQTVNTTGSAGNGMKCYGGNSCEGRCKDYLVSEVGVAPPTCHCDPYCTQLKDCCADFTEKCRPKNKTGVSARKTAYEIDSGAWRCYQYTGAGGNPGVWMIATCPESYTDNHTRAKCEKAGNRPVTSLTADLLSSIPTVYCHAGLVGKDCVTFRNIHCAQCNGVAKPSFWKVTWKCDFKPPEHYNETEKIHFLLNYCKDFRVKPRAQSPYRRYCYPVTSRCSHGNYDERLRAACENGSVGIVYEKKTETDYKNYACLQCNGHSKDAAICGPHGMPHDVFNPKSFEILLQFGISPWERDTRIQKFPIKPSCDGGQVYDSLLEECRNGTFPDPKQSILDKFRFKLWMSKVSERHSTAISLPLLKVALAKAFSLSEEGIKVVSLREEEASIAAVFDLSAVNGNRTETLNSSIEFNTLFHFKHSFDLQIGNETWTVFKVTRRLLACTNPSMYPPGEFVFFGARVILNNSTTVNSDQVQLLTRNHTDLGVVAGSLYVCWSFFAVACRRGEVLLGLKPSDYEFNNGTLLFKAAGVIYESGEFDIQGTRVWVCTNYTNTTTGKTGGESGGERRGDVLLWYFTVCGLPLSIIALGFLLVTYIMLKELHTLPGKNLMSLCVSLALAQFFWLLASGDTDTPMFCHIAAMVMHYLFLVSFACMCVIAYDTRRAFPQHQAPITGNTFPSTSNFRLCCYLAFSWGLPLVYVALCVVLDNQGVVAIGYGNPFNCWLTDHTGEMVFFGAPVAMALLFNLVAFVRTVRAIRSTKMGSKRLCKQTGNQADEVKIYFRLVTLMGFTWFFGLGANFIHPYLRYPFVLLTSLHGLYLAMAFAIKPHVFKLYKEKLGSLKLMSRKNTVSFVESNSKSMPSRDVESVL